MDSQHSWSNLEKHYKSEIENHHLKDFLNDKKRNQGLVTEFDGIILDYTHERINQNTIGQLSKLWTEAKVDQKINGLFNGDKLNSTQNRSVLHTVLRAPLDSTIHSKYEQIGPILADVHKVLNRIDKFSKQIRSGKLVGASGKQLQNLIVIGIGGSYLSIEFIYEALKSHPVCLQNRKGRTLRFLANVDPIDFARAVQGLNVQETLLLVNSKTFTTAQTILNAKSCKKWLIEGYKQLNITDDKLIAKSQICACSTNLPLTRQFGISDQNVFEFGQYVGGRFSVWSSIGILPLSITFGYQIASQFLRGGHSIDKHLLQEKEIHKNIPALLGLLGFYRTTIQGYTARCIVPYCQALCKFAPHIQQLDMESNGKGVTINGGKINYPTAVVNFGEPGTNGQHSFFQLLHQGHVIPVEFIGFTKSQQPYNGTDHPVSNHDQLMSNFFSQPDALAVGKSVQDLKSDNTPEKLIPHKFFPGNRPSLSLLFLGELNAYKCGQLLAMYEHRTSIEGFIWDVNSYDQYGVQLGKVLATKVRIMMKQGKVQKLNSATSSLLQKYLHSR